MSRQPNVLIVLVEMTATEANEAAFTLSEGLDNKEFMSQSDTRRATIESAMRKLYAANPAARLETT